MLAVAIHAQQPPGKASFAVELEDKLHHYCLLSLKQGKLKETR